jgi:hypothetical protein
LKILSQLADDSSSLVMERINIPERLDPSSRIGDAKREDHLGEKRQSRRKKAKAQTPVTPEASTETDDESHQLDELA